MKSPKRNMSCNIPIKSWKPSKKKVVKACSSGKEKIIHFGATGYGNNYSTAARRSFRARHKCNLALDKLTARYWACKNLWTKGGDRQACPSNRICKYYYKKTIRKSRRSKSSKKTIRKSRRRKSTKSRRSKSSKKTIRKSRRRKSIRRKLNN